MTVSFWEKDIICLFTDGGLVTPNPSKLGGTWAWCGVSKDGEHVREVSAYLLPNTSNCPGNPRVNSDTITNNDVEFYADLRALESMKDGWSGILATDSRITIERLQKCRQGLVPSVFRMDWYSRAHSAFERLGDVRMIQLVGHPNQKELEQGFKILEDGTKAKVSRHNVWCDQTCTELAKTYEYRVLGWQTYVQQGIPDDALKK